MSYDLRFAKFVIEELKESHPFFRYPLLTAGDYEPYLHQAEIFYRLLPRVPIRFLIADDVGLGKTIEGIMVIDQLIKRRKIKRILLVVPRVLVKQWIYELNRFRREWNLSITEYTGKESVDKEGIYVVSVDTIKRENHKQKFSTMNWDLIIVDEIHKIGVVGSKENLRYKVMADFAGKNPISSFLGLSATPHRGNDNDYLKRLNLIDPYLREADEKLLRNSVRAVILRRNKDNVNKVYEEEKIFPDAVFIQYIVEPTSNELAYYVQIRELTLSILKEYYNYAGKKPNALQLLAFMIGRRSISSPRAGFLTFKRMLEKRATSISEQEVIEEAEEYAENEDTEEDMEPDEIAEKLASLSGPFLDKYRDSIQKLAELANEVMNGDSRIKALMELVKSHVQKGDKIIIFTEYKDTANYIYEKFANEFKSEEIKVVTSETAAKEGIENIKKWLEKGGTRIMVATDVAAEGLNLQSANVLIHYELPLSIVKFEQRNGRIWRLKQNKPVYIYYLALNTPIEQSILDNYYNKLLEITKGTGSEVNVADALVYKSENVKKIFNLSQDKESVPVYLAYNDPEKKEENITSIKIWESVIQGKIDDIVNLMIRRIKILKDTMKKFALYDSFQGAAVMDINTVRELTGFRNRGELRKSLESFLKEILKKVNGKIDNDKVKYPGGVLEYDISRIGKIINDVNSIISFYSKDKKEYVLCDSLSYNVYLVEAKLKIDNNELFTLPIIIDSNLNEITLFRFFNEILPLTLNCRKIYPDEVVVNEISSYSMINNVRSRIFKLLDSYMRYRQMRGKDKWLPDSRDKIMVKLEIKGGVIGLNINNGDYISKSLEILKKKGLSISESQGIYRIEGKGEVKYVKIVSPKDIFEELNKQHWIYTYSNGALVGVKNGV
ncbi:DEAD/DEAH box helicase [Saccharolobus shibatae]|uniref:Uncharacterized protein n=1 Tax=Saccharolobus shibatae TaxID=2286 RepID=A0A8F5C122_9CREN|nr:helicase-related protein [Saccharolobus shibatae]QXJ35000.1 hypothetical protein J5U22_01547 [Saccharolobus shibatae]